MEHPFKNWKTAAYFFGYVFLATVVINTILNHLPANIGGPLVTAQRGY